MIEKGPDIFKSYFERRRFHYDHNEFSKFRKSEVHVIIPKSHRKDGEKPALLAKNSQKK